MTGYEKILNRLSLPEARPGEDRGEKETRYEKNRVMKPGSFILKDEILGASSFNISFMENFLSLLL